MTGSRRLPKCCTLLTWQCAAASAGSMLTQPTPVAGCVCVRRRRSGRCLVTAAAPSNRGGPDTVTDPERSQWPRQRRESEPQRRTRLLNELAVLNERLRGGSPSEVARTRAKVQWLQNRSWRNWELIRQYMSSSSGAVTLSLIEVANSKARRGGYWAWARQCVSPSRREAVHTTCAAASLAGLGASCTAPPARMDSLAGRPAVD